MSDTHATGMHVYVDVHKGESAPVVNVEIKNAAMPHFGAEHAGKLLYISTQGQILPLTLGEGLVIVDGVLTLGGVSAEFTADDEGNIMIANLVFEATDEDGTVSAVNSTFTAQPDGSVLVE